MLKPKEDNDKMLKTLRDIISSSPNNRTCFDCGQKGVTYVNSTIGTFVCSTCSGILRGLTPPHRIKSISMATFTPEELDFIRTHGNDECAKTWLGLWDSKRTLKQDHRDFMVDKYERKRYYLEPASPLKSINTQSSVTTPSQPPQAQQQQQQQQAMVNGNGTKHSIQSSDNLAVLKSIQLTPPSANNRQHRTHHLHHNQNGNGHVVTAATENGVGSSNSNNNNFFTNHLNGTTNGSHNGVSNEFIADFRKASIYNSNNSLNSTGSGGGNSGHQVNGKITNGMSETTTRSNNNGDLNANFADFENNKIYNAAGLPMSTSSLSNNSLNSSSNGTFTSNSSLNSTPSADRYAALKDLDEQLREAKVVTPVDQPQQQQQQQQHQLHQNPPVNPFKNPFQTVPMPMQQQQQPQQQQSYQNWTFPDTQSNNFSGFGSPPLGTNGFYYANNMTNGMITQPSPFGGKAVFGNPFMTNGAATASTNNPFL